MIKRKHSENVVVLKLFCFELTVVFVELIFCRIVVECRQDSFITINIFVLADQDFLWYFLNMGLGTSC